MVIPSLIQENKKNLELFKCKFKSLQLITQYLT